MNNFAYVRPNDVDSALNLIRTRPKARFLAGGTNLLDLWKMGVEQPQTVIDISRLGLTDIAALPDNAGLRIGSLARNSEVAEHPLVVSQYPVLSRALLAGASPQLRNAATIGGNLMQRTRCPYFYDPAFPACNKRQPGSGCGALNGYNRNHAILGQSDRCIATNPSDMCVALAILDAKIRVTGPDGDRVIPIADFHRLPEDHPELDTTLQPTELITAVDLPPMPDAKHSAYLKVRDRSLYAFALVSVAAALVIESGPITSARIAVGGVAHKPWRVPEAEALMQGASPDRSVFELAANRLLQGAHAYRYNQYKLALARKTIVRALQAAAAAAS
jgi:xanthine dehydrogenase YagS FAD-binding subunit